MAATKKREISSIDGISIAKVSAADDAPPECTLSLLSSNTPEVAAESDAFPAPTTLFRRLRWAVRVDLGTAAVLFDAAVPVTYMRASAGVATTRGTEAVAGIAARASRGKVVDVGVCAPVTTTVGCWCCGRAVGSD